MSVPFDLKKGLIVVPVRVWGPKGDDLVEPALDTGATTTLIRTAVLVALGYDPAAAPDRVQVTTGSGVEFTPRLNISRISTLGHARAHFPILAHTLPPTASIDGLLGLDFLRGKRLVIDFRRARLGLH